MTHSRVAFTLVVASIATLAFARGNLKELTVPLKYTPQEGVHTTSADLTPALLEKAIDVRVEDARQLEREQGRGDEDAVLHGVDGLAADTHPRRQLGLGPALGVPRFAQTVHQRLSQSGGPCVPEPRS